MLSEQIDHLAFQQRINKELGNTRRLVAAASSDYLLDKKFLADC